MPLTFGNPSSQRHTLPKSDDMHPISEVIILNNDQHQHKKTATTNNRIKSKIKQQHTTFIDWCYCFRDVLFQKMFVCCLQVCLAWTTILLPNRGIAKNMSNFRRVCLCGGCSHFILFY